jgi:hypothetical protein
MSAIFNPETGSMVEEEREELVYQTDVQSGDITIEEIIASSSRAAELSGSAVEVAEALESFEIDPIEELLDKRTEEERKEGLKSVCDKIQNASQVADDAIEVAEDCENFMNAEDENQDYSIQAEVENTLEDAGQAAAEAKESAIDYKEKLEALLVEYQKLIEAKNIEIERVKDQIDGLQAQVEEAQYKATHRFWRLSDKMAAVAEFFKGIEENHHNKKMDKDERYLHAARKYYEKVSERVDERLQKKNDAYHHARQSLFEQAKADYHKKAERQLGILGVLTRPKNRVELAKPGDKKDEAEKIWKFVQGNKKYMKKLEKIEKKYGYLTDDSKDTVITAQWKQDKKDAEKQLERIDILMEEMTAYREVEREKAAEEELAKKMFELKGAMTAGENRRVKKIEKGDRKNGQDMVQ